MHIALDIKVLRQDGTLVLTDHDGKAITFSKEQTIQQKVRMITLGELCDLPTHQLANSFGFKTRKSYDDIRNAVLHGSPADLMPKRMGPHTPPKRTKEVEALIIRRRFATDENMDDIADAFTQLGFDVSARLVGQVLADDGLSKKTRVAKSARVGSSQASRDTILDHGESGIGPGRGRNEMDPVWPTYSNSPSHWR